jgi:DNA primase
MNSPVTQIKERLSIEDVVSSYIKVERAGANLKARCPFHNEKTASFFISPGRGSYYCFGCGASGDIFTFVEEFEGLDFKGALKLLAGRAGVTLDHYNKEEESERERLYKALEETTKFFVENLENNKEVKAYLKDRGLEEKTIKDFRIGYALNDWRTLYFHLQKKGFTDAEIEKAGLAKKAEKGFYDRFRGRIMFPIADSSGRIIAFSGRIFVDDGKSAKYLNSPDTPVFSKSSVLYGLDKAKESIRKNNFSILVEGQMDLVLSHQAGFKNTIATSGTALSDATISKENAVSNLGLVRRLSSNIVLAFDADKAGFNASMRAGKIALALGMDVKVASLPDGIDPADLISKNGERGVELWREAIRNSKHLIEFLLDRTLKIAAGDMRKAGREIKEKILPYVAALESTIEQSHFVKKISDSSSILESALREDLAKIEVEGKVEREELTTLKSSDKKGRRDYIFRRLLGIIFWQNMEGGKLIDPKVIIIELEKILNKKEEEIFKEFENHKEDLVFEAEVFYGTTEDLKRDTEEMLDSFREEFLKEEVLNKMREMRIAESKNDTKLAGEIWKDINEVSMKIQEIKNNRHKK